MEKMKIVIELEVDNNFTLAFDSKEKFLEKLKNSENFRICYAGFNTIEEMLEDK